MKNNEKSKPTKKKILTYYLVTGACLLVIAAIVVGVVFAVKSNKVGDVIDKPNNDTPNITNPDDGNNGGNTNKPNDDNPTVDTSSKYELIVPVKDANVIKAHVFGYDQTMDWYRLHEGMDFAAAAGTQVFAAVDGRIKEISTSDVLYGATITIEHENGVTTVYKFVEPAEGMKVGDSVNRGEVIATIAAANGVENKDGDHLHFEVYKDGKIADPDDYLELTSK